MLTIQREKSVHPDENFFEFYLKFLTYSHKFEFSGLPVIFNGQIPEQYEIWTVVYAMLTTLGYMFPNILLTVDLKIVYDLSA